MPSSRRTNRIGPYLAVALTGAALVTPIAFGATSAAATPAVAHRPAAAARANVSGASIVADINAVRKAFHLPPGTMTNVYRSEVVAAANALRDPILKLTPAGVVAEDGVWGATSTTGSAATLNANEIVHTWVYEDGWRGTATANDDCTSPHAPGCNDHRRAILHAAPRRGAKLSIDAFASTKPIHNQATLSIAAVLSWST